MITLRSVPATGTTWVDALDPDDAELADLARTFRYSDAVVGWLHDSQRGARPHQLDDTLVFALPIPPADTRTGEASATDPAVLVVVGRCELLTVHGAALGTTIDALAHPVDQTDPDRAAALVLALIDEIVERYEIVVDQLTEQQAAHGTRILQRARGSQSPADIVADSLELATDVDRVLSRLRALRQVVAGLRRIASTGDTSPAFTDALDGSDRTSRLWRPTSATSATASRS